MAVKDCVILMVLCFSGILQAQGVENVASLPLSQVGQAKHTDVRELPLDHASSAQHSAVDALPLSGVKDTAANSTRGSDLPHGALGALMTGDSVDPFAGCQTVRLSGVSSHQNARQGLYTRSGTGCHLSRNIYRHSAGYRLFYTAANGGSWAFSGTSCSTVGFVISVSTAAYPEDVTRTWQEVSSSGNWVFNANIDVTCGGDASHVTLWVVMVTALVGVVFQMSAL